MNISHRQLNENRRYRETGVVTVTMSTWQ